MRAGGCAVQQALTAEAAAVVKQAVSLARRRGNAQVTPLHVASAMLASPSGLLRAACLRSQLHSYPLQCKALELCFNVALNRLPASAAATSPLLGHHHYYPPSLSNALVAAFKRAQAHQRRGSVESQQQQQPVLAVKVELEQLVVSILDDPSVSRVMREAGFSSTQVKANVEQPVCSNTTTTPQNPNPSSTTTSPPQETKAKLSLDQVRDEDVNAILDAMATRTKRKLVVVAEYAAAAEAVAWAAMDKIKRGEARHDALRGAQLVSLRVSSFRDTPREDTERRLAELRCVVRSRLGQVVLLLEDLKWAAESWAGRAQGGRSGYYCAVEHVITEVRALACSGGDTLWLIGFGTYQTYMKCRTGQPSLESLWGLQTLTVPAGSLALSLTCATDGSALAVNHCIKANSDTNGNNGSASSWSFLDGSRGGGSAGGQLISRCCGDCSAAKIGTKALPRSFLSSSSLPSWLQHCRDRESSHLTDLCKWSSICSPPSHIMTLHFSAPVSPASSVSSYEHSHHQPWLLGGLDAKHPWKANGEVGTTAKSHDSGSSNCSVEVECHSKFKELTAENLKLLCAALEKEAPWQREVIPEIASTVLRCRSMMAKRRDTSRSVEPKEETWLLFLGGDADGKEKVARKLASLVFGSRKNFLSISLDSSSPSPSGSTEEHRRKRPRQEASQAYLDRLYQTIAENPHRVIMMEDVEEADKYCQLGIKEAIESGVVRSHRGEEAAVGDAIFILSCEGFDARSRACSPPSKQMKVEREHASDHGASSSSSSCFDLNLTVEGDAGEQCCSGHVGLLKAVDRTLFFRIPEDL